MLSLFYTQFAGKGDQIRDKKISQQMTHDSSWEKRTTLPQPKDCSCFKKRKIEISWQKQQHICHLNFEKTSVETTETDWELSTKLY